LHLYSINGRLLASSAHRVAAMQLCATAAAEVLLTAEAAEVVCRSVEKDWLAPLTRCGCASAVASIDWRSDDATAVVGLQGKTAHVTVVVS